MIKILVVDDQNIFRSSVVRLLNDEVDFSVIGEADNGDAAIEFVEKNPGVDVILMDVKMPGTDGITATKKIIEKNEDANIVMLTMTDTKDIVIQSFIAGAKSFISKSDSPEHMIDAIRTVHRGRYYITSEAAQVLVHNLNLRARGEEIYTELIYGSRPEDIFTDRELDILYLISSELSTQDIADELGLAKRTVENHRQNMIDKIKVKNVVGLVMYAVNTGYLNRREKKSKSPKGHR